ncbi:glycosyltransferase family 1 protein [Deinococcus yavapaiensis]|uniref:Glycosyltransferase involved in cell wall biosynthesis n=1 Tax=Deinococcus yavapaiensis KR-236 TaxID=694435 RepID=A0A318S7J6_9DEIO|nr:glycosyltransferase family 1 protein [Deinococcus yavapaiensis]PYE53026.1 glycosyltransferase involved in cell wall biosynthesis [Deinococcus yavapaiensis KR-236]
MTRAARHRRVLYFEEPIFGDGDFLECKVDPSGVVVLTPHVEAGHGPAESQALTAKLLHAYMREHDVRDYVLWVYTPFELPVTAPLFEEGPAPACTVYDCMDELAQFRGAPPELRERERQLFGLADVVFTGGYRIWENKRLQHDNAHPFPSSVEVSHFAQARAGLAEPQDQIGIPGPKLGFYGVIDERFDIDLVREVAARRPEWQFVFLGPVVKISEHDLPRGANIHYLGMKKYTELPAYLAHWDVALLPFARNDATEYISPTKTPEYLAAGVPVVSTNIRDVIRPWGEEDVVRIAVDADEFEAAIEEALAVDNAARQAKADRMLARLSWDRTWAGMEELILEAMTNREMIKGVTNYDDASVNRVTGSNRTSDVARTKDLEAVRVIAPDHASGANVAGVADD